MGDLFTTLSHAVEGDPAIALSAAFAWGMASLLLSPCHLSSIPLVVGFVNGQERASARRGVAIAALFSLGLFTTIAVVGGVTAAAGRMLGDLGPWPNYLVALVFFAVGLSLLDVIPIGWGTPALARFQGRGPAAALVLGLVFGIALGPCTFAYMAPMLGVVFKVAAARPAYAFGLLGAYGLGHCAIIVLAGTFAELAQHYLNWNERSRGAVILRKVCGVLVLAAGGYLVFVTF